MCMSFVILLTAQQSQTILINLISIFKQIMPQDTAASLAHGTFQIMQDAITLPIPTRLAASWILTSAVLLMQLV